MLKCSIFLLSSPKEKLKLRILAHKEKIEIFFISSDCWRTKFKVRSFFTLWYEHPPYLADEAYSKHLRYILHTQSRRAMPGYLDVALKNGLVRRMSDFSY
jgi:hypothetical protein